MADTRRRDGERCRESEERGSLVGYAAIKYAAIVIAILYFLAVFVVLLFR